MKKVFAIMLIAVMILGLAACGMVNKTEISILWADAGVVKVPNSLINALERAMYTQKLSYAHYGANGDQAAQTKQAEEAVNKGCSALMVNLVDPAAAQSIVDMAKAKNVPVIFFGCDVDAAVLSGYDKCALVNTDAASIDDVQGDMIGKFLTVEKKSLFGGSVTYTNFEALDRNQDGKISYAVFGQIGEAVQIINEQLGQKGLNALEAVSAQLDQLKAESYTVEEKVFFLFNKTTEYGKLTNAAGDAIELIITDGDDTALELLSALQEKEFNHTKLATHFVPVYTVGNQVDARQFTDTANMTEEELAEFIYTVDDLIGAGLISGSAVEDLDTYAAVLAAITKNAVQGNDLMKDVEGAEGKKVLISYTANAADA